MSVRNVQLLKWTFPAFALIIGLFWYKRRRVDRRVDPGGIQKTDKKENISQSDQSPNIQRNSLNLYDSGIHVDESLAPLNTVLKQSPKNIVCSPRRVSESLDIPTKKSSPHSFSVKSSGEKFAWYDDIEDLPEMKQVVLGSNPKSSNFDLMNRSKAPVILEKINDDVEFNVDKPVEEEVIKKQESVAVDHGRTRSVSIETCEKPVDEVTTDDSKASGQAISERDSANHSPVSAVLDGSVNDEVRSEGSTDSGKGGSINGKISKTQSITTYEFEMPKDLVGKFIGRRGSSIQNLNSRAKVTISVKLHPIDKNLNLCVIEGLPDNIKTALKLIRRVFPLKKNPQLTLEQVHMTINPEEISWVTELMYLQLVEGVNNDVLVCHIMEPNRLFIQLPTHPTHPSLRILDHHMTHFYDTVDAPAVPDQLSKGMLVVAKWYGKWVRAYIEEPEVEEQTHLCRLVDHGGFWTFTNAEMRKIRSDYLTLPFQAIEVSLANISPVGGEWQPEAYEIIAQICSGSIGQAQIEGYIDSMVFVSLYINMPKHGVISVADELIARGLAEATELENMVPEPILCEPILSPV